MISWTVYKGGNKENFKNEIYNHLYKARLWTNWAYWHVLWVSDIMIFKLYDTTIGHYLVDLTKWPGSKPDLSSRGGEGKCNFI